MWLCAADCNLHVDQKIRRDVWWLGRLFDYLVVAWYVLLSIADAPCDLPCTVTLAALALRVHETLSTWRPLQFPCRACSAIKNARATGMLATAHYWQEAYETKMGTYSQHVPLDEVSKTLETTTAETINFASAVGKPLQQPQIASFQHSCL